MAPMLKERAGKGRKSRKERPEVVTVGKRSDHKSTCPVRMLCAQVRKEDNGEERRKDDRGDFWGKGTLDLAREAHKLSGKERKGKSGIIVAKMKRSPQLKGRQGGKKSGGESLQCSTTYA